MVLSWLEAGDVCVGVYELGTQEDFVDVQDLYKIKR